MKQRLYNLSYGRTPPAQWDVDGAFGEQDDQGNPRPAHEYQDALRAFQVGHGIPTSELGTEGPQTKQKLRTIDEGLSDASSSSSAGAGSGGSGS